MEETESASLTETPTYTVAIVITCMVALSIFFQRSLEWSKEWLEMTKRKSLVSAHEKIQEELMLFGFLSLLMGHWMIYFATICVKHSTSASRFYPCARRDTFKTAEKVLFPSLEHLNGSDSSVQIVLGKHSHCTEILDEHNIKKNIETLKRSIRNEVLGHEPFVSYESLEQLHRLLFVLVFVHISYCFASVALAVSKIDSWRTWENQSKEMSVQVDFQAPRKTMVRRMSSFVVRNTSHPWSEHRVLIWLLCFGRQFWSSINRADYVTLRLGFISTHKLPPSYDFHNYILRSMEDDFRDIVGTSIPFWIYAILCILLDFHGTHVYFWMSFLPAILTLVAGTKLHQVVVKVAVEIRDTPPSKRHLHLNLRDKLFWLGKPQLLLWLVKFISFQNAFEMATFLWSLWEIGDPYCFMANSIRIAIRLIFGVVSQFWCSFVTFPLYLIVTQLGSSFGRSLVSENVRSSLVEWKNRAANSPRMSSPAGPLLRERSYTSADPLLGDRDGASSSGRSRLERSFSEANYLSSTTVSQGATASLLRRRSYKTLEELMFGDPFRYVNPPAFDAEYGSDPEYGRGR